MGHHGRFCVALGGLQHGNLPGRPANDLQRVLRSREGRRRRRRAPIHPHHLAAAPSVYLHGGAADDHGHSPHLRHDVDHDSGRTGARDRDGRHIHLCHRVPLPTRRVRAIAGFYSLGPGGAADVALDCHAAQARERDFGMSRLMRRDTRVQILLHGLLVCLFVIWGYPVIWTLTSSLKASGDLYSAPWSLPHPAHFENIAHAWVQGRLGQAFLNSAYVTAVSVSLILLFAVPAAFGFARLRLPFPAVLGLAILVPLMIPSEVILVPLFVMFRALGLLNTLEGLITLEVAGGVAFATVVLTTFFRGVPRELEDAARIDGARSAQVLWHIILPLAGPGIAAVAVFQSVFVWNDYFAPLIVIQKPSLFTVQLAIGNFSNFYTTDESLLFAGLALAMRPPLVVFAILQRYFIQGLTVGALRD